MSKYIDFKRISEKHEDYLILTKSEDLLGTLLQCLNNKQLLFPEKETVFSAGCLDDIADFFTVDGEGRNTTFHEDAPMPRTLRWSVKQTQSNDVTILVGEVKWYARWRQYSFFPFPNKQFDKKDIRDISAFIKAHAGDRV